MSLSIRTLSILLSGTTLVGAAPPLFAQDSPGEQAQDDATEVGDTALDNESSAIVVTGTRIRGARVIGEVIELDRDTIVEAGQVDLGEAIRSLPQNFSGGQNPGVGSGAGFVNENVNSASTANLRGIGADATLTLLNGHRLPYNSAFQGVDISAIPLAAVDRIEVVPDGASALYGSDAVGGVINVILRRDFDGLTTSGQLGAATDGGYFRQQFDAVGGTGWQGGGLMLAYDYAHNSSIRADQRSYAATLDPEVTLYPDIRRHALTLSAHQELAPGIRATIDGFYSRRTTRATNGAPAFRITQNPKLEGYAIAPALAFDIGSGWEAKIAGVYGSDQTRLVGTFVIAGSDPIVASGQYFNETITLEASAEGPLFDLPGGSARLAMGAGFRDTSLAYDRNDGTISTTFNVKRRARFAFGELYLPLVSPQNDVAGIAELTVTAAVRYEDYPGLDQQATPRIAVRYAPAENITLRASWARSFKAPTLYQQYVFYQAIAVPASFVGAGTGSDTIIAAAGGNPDVEPERARSWTVGFDFSPPSLPEITISGTWYDIRFTNRVVAPISGSVFAAYGDPAYASLVNFTPTLGAINGLINGAQFGLENFTGAPFDPASVIAIIDNRNVNVAAWSIHGVDARIDWNHELGDRRSVGFDLSGSWLNSEQRIVESLPLVQLAGTVFNPPQYRLRGTARLGLDRFRTSVSLNYIGALLDRRFESKRRLAPSATLDLAATYTLDQGDGREPSLELSFSIQNLFDQAPRRIEQFGPYDTPYDSTNYSPIGRFISVGIRRHW